MIGEVDREHSDPNDLPAELIGAAPRNVRLTGTGLANALTGSIFFGAGVTGAIYMIGTAIIRPTESSKLWSLIFPIGLAIFGLLFVRRFPLQRRLAREGIAVRGCIAENEWNGPSRGQRYVNYTFRNADTDEVESGSCPSDHYPKPGSKIWVLYLASNPNRSEIYPFGIEFFRVDP